jgi:hypothetical protein
VNILIEPSGLQVSGGVSKAVDRGAVDEGAGDVGNSEVDV